MTTLVIVLALFGIAYSVKKTLAFWTLHQAVHPNSSQNPAKEDSNPINRFPLKVSFIGSIESGKSQLQTSIAYQLQNYATTSLNIRLLTHKEEEKLRGRLLKTSNDSDDYREQNLDEYNSESLIQARRLAFQDDRYYQKSSAIENCFLLTTFSKLSKAQESSIELKPQCLNLLSLPGHFLLDERGQQGHFKTALQDSKALVLVLDGLKLIEAYEQDQDYPFAIHYTQALEYYYQHASNRTVYVVISKSDCIMASLEPDYKNQVEEYLQQKVLPLLQLEENNQDLKIYWTSVDHQSEALWEAVGHLGLDLVKQIKSKLLEQQVEDQKQSTDYQTSRSQLVYILSIATLLLWSMIGALKITNLPTLKGDVTWDWGSLKTSSAPYVSAYQSAQSTFHPLRPYEARLRSSLKALKSEYFNHFNGQSRNLINSLPEQKDLMYSSKLLSNELQQYLNYQKQVMYWLKKKDFEAQRIKDIQELVQDIKAWNVLKQSPKNMLQIHSQFRSLNSNKWQKRCEYSQGENDLACLVQDSYLSMYKKALAQALSVTTTVAMTKKVQDSPTILIHHLSPLLQWQRYSQYLTPRDPLLLDYNRLMDRAWQNAWQQLLGRLSKSKLNEGVGRLQLIETFELNRRELEIKYALKLPMPKRIMGHWIELLNREVDQQKQSLQAQEMIIWAENYLDHHRAARVRLSQAEISWQTMITHALNRTHQDQTKLQEAIEKMKLDLATLQSLNGANDIKSSIELWQNRLKKLEAWTAPQKIKFLLEGIECDADRFEKHGYKINEGDWSYYTIYYPDSLKYYLRLQSLNNSEWIDVAQVDIGDTIDLTWRPWQKLKFSVYDQDGTKDVRTPISSKQVKVKSSPTEQGTSEQTVSEKKINKQAAGEKAASDEAPNNQEISQEKDDDQVGKAREWHEQRDPPNGTIQFAPEGLCSAKIQSMHPLPKWLFELKWLKSEAGF